MFLWRMLERRSAMIKSKMKSISQSREDRLTREEAGVYSRY